jgi:hypothetical protein
LRNAVVEDAVKAQRRQKQRKTAKHRSEMGERAFRKDRVGPLARHRIEVAHGDRRIDAAHRARDEVSESRLGSSGADVEGHEAEPLGLRGRYEHLARA